MYSIASGFLAGPVQRGDDRPTGRRTEMRKRALADVARRGRDVMLCLLLLCSTLPLLLIVALLIKLDSPGPVLYRQERVGLQGRRFHLWKLRSMRTDAETSGPVWAARHDPRVTRIGAFIRAHRIDELPQLVNVLRGEMSLVGPRPERPVFVEQLTEVIPGFVQRTCVLPGLTGWAQVNCPYGASVEDARVKFVHDLYYIRQRSLRLDWYILLRTVGVVLRRIGAR